MQTFFSCFICFYYLSPDFRTGIRLLCGWMMVDGMDADAGDRENRIANVVDINIEITTVLRNDNEYAKIIPSYMYTNNSSTYTSTCSTSTSVVGLKIEYLLIF